MNTAFLFISMLVMLGIGVPIAMALGLASVLTILSVAAGLRWSATLARCSANCPSRGRSSRAI